MNIRDALARKQQRETHYDILIADPTEAEQKHNDARSEARLAEIRHGDDSDEAGQARAAEQDAASALTACFHRVTFRNLPAHEFEALVNTHPPAKAQQDKGDQWDEPTFAPALIAACAVDSDMTEQDWAGELATARWSVADRTAIFMKALEANISPRSVTVPKG